MKANLGYVAAFTSMMLAVAAASAHAEAPDIKGRRMGRTSGCDDLVITVVSQAPSGVIGGDTYCTRTGVRVPFGEKLVQGKQMAGRFDGTDLHLVMEQGYVRAKFQDGRLVSHTFGGPSAAPTEVIFVRP